MPKIFYPLFFLDPPDDYVRKCESIFYEFIWGKHDLIKSKALIANTSEGGLNMMDIESQIIECRASWTSKILNRSGDWTFFGRTYIDKFVETNLFFEEIYVI